MDKFLKSLITFNKRDYIGLACWTIVGILCGAMSLLVMIAREIYQYKKYHLSRFEWEDVIRYSLVILLGCIAHYEILSLLIK